MDEANEDRAAVSSAGLRPRSHSSTAAPLIHVGQQVSYQHSFGLICVFILGQGHLLQHTVWVQRASISKWHATRLQRCMLHTSTRDGTLDQQHLLQQLRCSDPPTCSRGQLGSSCSSCSQTTVRQKLGPSK